MQVSLDHLFWKNVDCETSLLVAGVFSEVRTQFKIFCRCLLTLARKTIRSKVSEHSTLHILSI